MRRSLSLAVLVGAISVAPRAQAHLILGLTPGVGLTMDGTWAAAGGGLFIGAKWDALPVFSLEPGLELRSFPLPPVPEPKPSITGLNVLLRTWIRVVGNERASLVLAPSIGAGVFIAGALHTLVLSGLPGIAVASRLSIGPRWGAILGLQSQWLLLMPTPAFVSFLIALEFPP